MNTFFYLALKFFALLPIIFIYPIAIKISFLLNTFRYRRNVIDGNLENLFLKRAVTTKKKIKKDFYRYLGQLLSESIKLFNCDKNFIKSRNIIKNDSIIKSYLKNKDVILVLGHYCNWEWALLASSLHFDAEMVGIYKPLNSDFGISKF